MYFTASNNYEIYLKNIEKYIDFEFDSIYVTVEDETEFSNGNNWTVPMIKKEIESLLDVIGNENGKLELKSLYLKCKDKQKELCIKVLQEIKAYTENN